MHTLSEVDYQKLKNFGDVMVTIVRNNRKPPLGIPWRIKFYYNFLNSKLVKTKI
jgi:hypothetical protein